MKTKIPFVKGDFQAGGKRFEHLQTNPTSLRKEYPGIPNGISSSINLRRDSFLIGPFFGVKLFP
jgi:hypothetical protein